MTLALVAWAVIPMSEDLVLSDINVDLIFVHSFITWSIWNYNGWLGLKLKISFSGSIRSAAQMVSYEVSIGIIIINVLLCDFIKLK